MGVKDDLIQVMLGQGYDFMTSAEEVSRTLKELKAKPPGIHQLYVGKVAISIKKEGKLRRETLNMPTPKRTRAKPGIYELAGKTGFARYDTTLKKGWVLKYHGSLTLPIRTLDPKDSCDRALCKRIIKTGKRLGGD